LNKDNPVAGFKTIEETEVGSNVGAILCFLLIPVQVPQLQAHCKKLTEAGRASSCRTFLNSLSQLLNSLTLWSSNDGLSMNLTDAEKRKEVRFLEKELQRLESVSGDCRFRDYGLLRYTLRSKYLN
jgi:hypothetical protein